MSYRTASQAFGASLGEVLREAQVASIAANVSRETGIPKAILMAIAWQESRYNTDARGSSGEIGMMQIMPATARLYGLDPGRLQDPYYAMRGAAKILRDLKARFSTWSRAVSAYNAGRPTSSNVGSYVRPVLQRAGLAFDPAGFPAASSASSAGLALLVILLLSRALSARPR